jgi:hypothetical protein
MVISDQRSHYMRSHFAAGYIPPESSTLRRDEKRGEGVILDEGTRQSVPNRNTGMRKQ